MSNQHQHTRASSEESYIIPEHPLSQAASDADAPSRDSVGDVGTLIQQIAVHEDERLQLMAENAEQSSRIAQLESAQEALKRQCEELQVAFTSEQGKAMVRVSS